MELVKLVFDIYAPLSSFVVRANEEITVFPQLISQSSSDEGLLVEIEPFNLGEEHIYHSRVRCILKESEVETKK